MNNDVRNIKLFMVFFKIGLGTIGGGYAMLTMMQHEIVEKKSWLNAQEFIDILAVSQAAPGLFSANIASHIGYKLGGLKSAIISVIGNILPSIIIILLIAISFNKIKDYKVVSDAFKALRPAVVALIAVPVFNMIKQNKMNWKVIFISFSVALLLYFVTILSPILIIVVSIVFGFIYGIIASRGIKGIKKE